MMRKREAVVEKMKRDGEEEFSNSSSKRRRFDDHVLASCCNSKQKLSITDLEEVSSGGVEMAETAETVTFKDDEQTERNQTTSFGDLVVEVAKLEPPLAPPSMEEAKIPSDAELEEFFSAAEKDIHNQFSMKYNFDVVKEEVLEGRYEWVRVEP